MDNQELERRLSGLVRDNCNGATLREFRVLDENSTELDAVVLWRHDREAGTHRAMLSKVSPNGMPIWGHYYRDHLDAKLDFEMRSGVKKDSCV